MRHVRILLHERYRILIADLIAVAVLLLLAIVPVQSATAASATLTIFWSELVPSRDRSPGALVVSTIAHDPSGSVVALARIGLQSVLIWPDERGPGRSIKLTTKALVSRVAQGPGQTLWLAGRINQRAYVPGGDIADGYLGKLDSQGRTSAEYAFRSGRFRTIDSMLSPGSGEILVAGRDGRDSWIAAVSPQGKAIWQRRIGIGKGVALSAVGDRIMVATLEGITKDEKKEYEEVVTLWRLDRAGSVLGHQTIRRGISSRPGAYYARLAVEKSRDAFYVLSAWHDRSNAKPLAVTKVSLDGTSLWRQDLSHSISQRKNRTWTSCNQGQTVLEDGDLLIACALETRIVLSRLDAKTGEVTVVPVPLPDCHEGRPAALFLMQRPSGAIWLIGSRPGNNVAASCTWLGELQFQ